MKKQLKFKLLILLFLFNIIILYSQNKDNFVLSSELITINNNEFLSILEKIISENKNYAFWYFEQKENDRIVVSQSRLLSLVELVGAEKLNISTTIINNKIVFIIYKNDISVLDKSGFKIDLSEYVTEDLIVYFEDYSSWLISYENGKYKIIDSYIWKK